MVDPTTALLFLLALAALGRTAGPVPGPGLRRFAATLTGAEEVPPVATAATGSAGFRVSESEDRIQFDLQVRNIRNMTEAHIHLGRPGVNGPIVAFLFGPARTPVTRQNFVATGTLTAADLVGPLRGRPLSALLREMRRGNTYVNVHTLANPEGEIRGQIRPA